MGDQQQRRTRLRLARRRTAPSQVRARVRVDDPAAAPSSDPDEETRRVPAQSRREPAAGTPALEQDAEPAPSREKRSWAHLATVIGAVAAIGSVAFSGWATYISAVVATDQLNQSREDSEKEERRQASRVTFWTEEEAGDFWKTMVNRTPDPVSMSIVYLTFTDQPWGGFTSAYASSDGLPPCTEIVFKLSDQKEEILALVDGWLRDEALEFSGSVEHLQFVDAAGAIWLRTARYLKKDEFAGREGDSGAGFDVNLDLS